MHGTHVKGNQSKVVLNHPTLGAHDSKRHFSFIIILLASICSTLILHKLYFLFSDKIWAMNIKVLPENLTPAFRPWLTQRDGIETYVLYLFAFANILLTFFLARSYEFLNLYRKRTIVAIALYALSSVFLLSIVYLLFSVGIIPPMTEIVHSRGLFIILSLILIGTWALQKIASWKNSLADIIILIALLPICFVAIQPISVVDYSYIFAPALRLINHVRISDIYFQYDLFLSILAAIWMKLKIDLNLFQILGQLSFYGFFIAAFFFSKNYFINKKLPYFFLISLVLIKVYALICDPVLVFQVTPLRLDLWILILIIAYKKGIFNKYVGLIMASMIILTKTFGLIYLLAYLELITSMIILDFVEYTPSMKRLRDIIKKYLLLSWKNLLIIGTSFIISFLLFRGITSEAASAYQKIGIGFLQISKASFYWYVFVLLALTFSFLVKKRKELTGKYFITGLFLIFLAIGNSLYFFGRSHENNIINIAGSLIFVLFLFFDLLSKEVETDKRDSCGRSKRIIVSFLPVIFILLITYNYSGRIIVKLKTQFRDISKGQLIYPMTRNYDTTKIKEVTKNSNKVYFLGSNDFYYYYYGDYVLRGHFSPYYSWVYKKDLVIFIQGLIEDGYFVVTPENELNNEQEILLELQYSDSVKKDGYFVLWK